MQGCNPADVEFDDTLTESQCRSLVGLGMDGFCLRALGRHLHDYLRSTPNMPTAMLTAREWHVKLGHPSKEQTSKMFLPGSSTPVPFITTPCPQCPAGKSKKHARNRAQVPKAKQYLDTEEAKECAEWQPDLVILGPFGKHDALGQYPPPPGGARYDEPATFSEEEFYAELKGMVEWAQGTKTLLPSAPSLQGNVWRPAHPATSARLFHTQRLLPIVGLGAKVAVATPIPFPFGSTEVCAALEICTRPVMFDTFGLNRCISE